MNVIPTAQQPWYPTGNQDMQSTLPVQPPVEQSSGEQIWFSAGTHIKPVTPLQQNGDQNGGAQHWIPHGNHNAQSGAEEQSTEVVSPERIYCVYFYLISYNVFF